MTHPGLPIEWVVIVTSAVFLLGAWSLHPAAVSATHGRTINLAELPVLGPLIRGMVHSPLLLFFLKLISVALFLLIIAAGLFGSAVPERNIATVLTWNIWWTGLIVSVFFLGSAWCAVCPWDALATWLVNKRLWRRGAPHSSLNLRVPRWLRSVWPALLMFIGLSWLELCMGITVSPYATALLALFIVVLATVSLAVYERKAFCRYFCPVGRTVGFYSQLAPVELRPIDTDICADCTTLECYYGNDEVAPCPTHLVMGRLQQNTYCTSCGNCTQSCPSRNVAWRLRRYGVEAIQEARPHADEAWFMLILFSLTILHGLSMMPFYESWVSGLAVLIGDSGRLLWSQSAFFILSLTAPVAVYLIFVYMTCRLNMEHVEIKRGFSGLAFSVLPLAFAYHIAHNLNHLLREGAGILYVLGNPLGIGTQPLTLVEKHQRYMHMLLPEDLLFALQAGLLIFGFWISLKVIQHRASGLFDGRRAAMAPMVVFAILATSLHLWLLNQPMVMRM